MSGRAQPKRRHLTGADRSEAAARLARRYEAGATAQGLAAEMGRSYTLARALLLEAGVTMRPKGVPKGAKRGGTR
ncbi:helix-turn-helix domain-containing protein [Streptomyces sp. NPDC053048]|uniref:helix-turn-helix domain-containing protein n=1 Tax=Streptomyces sp. NPDC053048 TaxID=3365694 RepID=UPI0037D0DD5B